MTSIACKTAWSCSSGAPTVNFPANEPPARVTEPITANAAVEAEMVADIRELRSA